MSYRHIITFVILLSWFYGCEKNTTTPEITNFPLTFILINEDKKDIDVNFSPTVYYPLGNFTRFAWRRMGVLNPYDTAVCILGGEQAYEGCERLFNLDIWVTQPDIGVELHWEFSSGLDTVENYDDRDMIFVWPKDSSVYELVSHDTIPLYLKGGQADYIPHEHNLSGRELDYLLK